MRAYGMKRAMSITGKSPLNSFVSIIIPAYNEEDRLADSLDQIVAFVRSQSYPVEVLVVDNASTDRTKSIITGFASQYLFIRYLYEAERGKGAAVRTGIIAGRGEFLLVCDADLSVPIAEVANFLPPRCVDVDIAIGSREVSGARRHREPLYRHLMGRAFNLLVRLLVLPGIRDTQCGFKCFRRDAGHELFSGSVISGWAFDVEVLARARDRGYRIMELPVNWYYRDQSKVRPLPDAWNMLRELIAIRKRSGREDEK